MVKSTSPGRTATDVETGNRDNQSLSSLGTQAHQYDLFNNVFIPTDDLIKTSVKTKLGKRDK